MVFKASRGYLDRHYFFKEPKEPKDNLIFKTLYVL